MIANGSVFGCKTDVTLKMLDIPQCMGVLEGVFLELQDGAYPNLIAASFHDNPEEAFKDCDVIVFVGGFPRREGMERKELLAKNGDIFRAQGAALEKVGKRNVKCVVVANPANTNCLILQQNAPSIPVENFTCLTRLDQNRAYAQIALKSGVSVTAVDGVIIWGNHSSTQYPDVNHAHVKGVPVRGVVTDENYLNNEFITKVQKRGAEIIKIKKTSSVFSAANATKDHLRDWYKGSDGKVVSMGIVSDGSYDVPKGLVYSFPVICERDFKYRIVKGLNIDKFSREKMDATAKELLEEKAEAFNE